MNQFMFETKKISELQDFYNSAYNGICFVEGKSGYFKTPIVNSSLQTLDDEYLVFKIKCFESTTLDDIFLILLEDIKKYSHQKKILLSKIETKSISQRILHYLSHINSQTIIIIDSLQNIFDKTDAEEKEEILRFISHINSMNKFKIVLISTFFPADISQQLEINTISKQLVIKTEPFTKSQTKHYFESQGINNPQELFEQFYEKISGNPSYIYITANIINTLGISLQNLLNEYSSKKCSFEDFLLQKLITFVPENVKKSLNTLSFFNGGLPKDFLIKNNLFTKEQIIYMLEKGILNEEYGLIYLKSYLKKYLQKSVSTFDKNRIHILWRDFYLSQLPAKPSDRIVLISRNTMRAQIEYHGSFVIQQKSTEKDSADMSLLSYLNSNLTAWNIKNTNIDEEEKQEETTEKQRPKPPKSLENKFKPKDGLEKYELTKDEIALLSVPIDMRQTKEQNAREFLARTFEQKEAQKKQSEKTIQELLEQAQEFEKVHDYENAAALYLKAYNSKTDVQYKEFIAIILENLAICCLKMNKTTEAIDFYNKLIELYTENNEIEKINEIRLEIAKIYKLTYKTSHAKLIYENFIKQKTPASDKIVLKSYIELAEIEEDVTNTEKAIEYYKKAFSIFENYKEDKTLYESVAEAYFKYALILDDFHQTQSALDYYQRCIRLSEKPSIYLSSSYTNVGEILKETGNIQKSIEYYKLGLKTDIEQSNYEGIYYTCRKIAQAYEKIDKTQVLNWLLKSLSAAKRTKDKLYISNAYKEIGDYYSMHNNEEKAKKAYNLYKKNDISNQEQ